MTDEEIAEEYAKGLCKTCTFDTCRHSIIQTCAIKESIKQAYKDGAEFGYNKANEWHKPSEKLPKECSLVLAYSFEDTEPALWEFVTSDQWEWLPKRIVFCSNDQIRLWKEIELPNIKEIKEND